MIKFRSRYGLNSGTAAAMTLARRGLGQKEKPPTCRLVLGTKPNINATFSQFLGLFALPLTQTTLIAYFLHITSFNPTFIPRFRHPYFLPKFILAIAQNN
jgi:hypothetical protein